MADELVSEPPNRRSERDRLLDDVRALVEGEDRFVAEYLIGSLDDRGLLDESTEEIARRLDVAPDRVRRVLAATREISPPGLGARSVVECLLLQLDRLEIEGVSVPRHCRTIVEHHLDALASGRLGLIAKNLETTDASILEVRAFIRDHLRPYVAWQAPDGPGEDPPPTPLVLPDVLIVERPSAPGEYEVEVVEATRLALRIDPTYAAMMKRIEDRARSGPAGDARAEPAGARHEVSSLSPHERRHVQTEVRRARFFLSRLRDRWETLLRVTTYVAERQRGFLREGPAALEPMTRAEVAAALGLHESTVSRATADKYVMLPTGRVTRFRDFFDPSLPAREELRHIIRDEERPLSDAQLTRRMGERGYHLARRTVTKYRHRLQVPPGALR